MDAILIHPKSEEQEKIFEQLAKVLQVPFEKIKVKHNEEYEAMLKESYQQAKAGKTVKLAISELWK